jgi:glyoxylase-like metal-dependent hydrolase (beta-lactamase superfamily II)
MWGMQLPDIERWSPLVVVVLGQNPGPFTGPGTNTYLVELSAPAADRHSGKPSYLPLPSRRQNEFGATHPRCSPTCTRTHWRRPMPAARPRRVSKMPWPGKDERYSLALEPIRAGDVFRTDGATLRAIHTPGHAEDHICFYLEEERALFTGDVVLGAGTTVIPLDGGDMNLYLATLERMLELELARIYPGHGPFIAEPRAKLHEYIEHRRERERQIIEAVRAGASTVERMVERIYADTPRALWPAAGQSVLSHLHKLEHERRALRSRDVDGEEHWALS